MGSFSCNFCAYDKEEQEKEAYHTLTTKAAESAENNFKKE